MSTTEQSTNPIVATDDAPADGLAQEPTISLELGLDESEALRAWLLKPAKDGATSLDDPLVSRTLTKLGREVDAVLATVNVPFQFGGQSVQLGASIGISLYPFDGETRQALVQAADVAMYRAKREGKNTYALHNPDIDD